MKLLEIIASVDPAGGGPIEAILRQDLVCRAAGVPVTRELLTLDPPNSRHLEAFPLKVHALGEARPPSPNPWQRVLAHWRYSPLFVPWLKDNVGNYDAVIVHGLWNYSSFGASRALPKCETPYFVFSHGMLDPWFKERYPLKHLAKQIFWLAGEGRLLAKSRSVLFTCEQERIKAHGRFWGYSRYPETVVTFGASPPPPKTPALEGAFRAAAPGLGKRPYLLFLSRIHPKKGCDLLVEAFARVSEAYPDIDLVMAGPDELGWGKELVKLASKLGVEGRIHWTGPLYGDAKWGALYGAELFTLPSHQENFGIVIAEALGCGVPVMITDKVDIWREIEAANAGLIGADTVNATEASLRSWLSADFQRKNALRQACRPLFDQSFNVENTAPALIDVIRASL